MTSPYRVLSTGPLAPGAGYVRRVDATADRVTPAAPALAVMTDLDQVQAVTVDPNLPIDLALERMKHAGVRLLLVITPQHEVIGLITARDIQGERPLKVQTEFGLTRGDVLVRDVMTGRDQLEALALADVERAQVGDIVATLKAMGRQHALVLEAGPGGPRVRGIFSTTRIARQLGVTIHVEGQAHSFAELEAALRG